MKPKDSNPKEKPKPKKPLSECTLNPSPSHEDQAVYSHPYALCGQEEN